MSSKEQYKDALKRDKQIINDLNKKVIEQELTIRNLKDELLYLRLKNGSSVTVTDKKWWQFWK